MKQPTNLSLEEAAVDVAYEFKMFRRAWNYYVCGSPAELIPPSPSLGHNSSAMTSTVAIFSVPSQPSSIQSIRQPKGDFLFLEGLLLHMRILIEFFYKEDRTDDDVLARDYSGVAQRAEPAWVFPFKQRCNKLLAHLTYMRTEHRSKNEHHWNDIEVHVQSMDKTIDEFLGGLTPERRSWFKNVGL